MSPCVLKSCICTDLEYCEGSVVPYVISFDDTVSAKFRSGCRFCFESFESFVLQEHIVRLN